MPPEDRHRLQVGFPTTQWSLVQRAANTTDGKTALEELLKRYLPALRAHLVLVRRLQVHDADDVLQAFVLNKVIAQRLIAHADRRHGKFRAFLRSVLDNYASNHCRSARAQSRNPTDPLGDVFKESVIAREGSPARAFEVAWARQLVGDALQRMRSECLSGENETMWAVFEERVLRPAAGESAPLKYRDLVDRLGFRSPRQAHNTLSSAKRAFIRHLRSVVAEYACDEPEIDEEIQDLKRILAAPRA